MFQEGVNKKVHYTLRIAIAMCFIGHGAFGIITKAIWCNYFGVVGIQPGMSYKLMPAVGCVDILLGMIVLLFPVRVVPAWLVFWGIATALMRPLSGEPFAEVIERAGNYGSPLAFLLLTGIPQNLKGWFTRIDPAIEVNKVTMYQVTTCLKIVSFLLMFGHGWLNLLGKGALLNEYKLLGFSNPAGVAEIVGIGEIAAALVVLIKPFRMLLFVFFLWKMSSELLYPQYAVFEWIERGGSYGALLALWIITGRHSAFKYTLTGEYFLRKVFTAGADKSLHR